MAFRKIDPATYAKLVEGFTLFPNNYDRSAKHAGVDYRMAKRFFLGGKLPLGDGYKPIKQLLADQEAGRIAQREAEDAAREEERERIGKEADRARLLETEALSIDEASMRGLRKTTLAGLAACSALTEGITLLAKRIGNQLASGMDASGKPLNIDVDKALRTMRDYSLTVGRLGQVVDVIASMERVKNNLPTAIIGLDVSHVTLEDAEREVEFAQDALKRARSLGLIVVDGGAGKTGTGR